MARFIHGASEKTGPQSDLPGASVAVNDSCLIQFRAGLVLPDGRQEKPYERTAPISVYPRDMDYPSGGGTRRIVIAPGRCRPVTASVASFASHSLTARLAVCDISTKTRAAVHDGRDVFIRPGRRFTSETDASRNESESLGRVWRVGRVRCRISGDPSHANVAGASIFKVCSYLIRNGSPTSPPLSVPPIAFLNCHFRPYSLYFLPSLCTVFHRTRISSARGKSSPVFFHAQSSPNRSKRRRKNAISLNVFYELNGYQ